MLLVVIEKKTLCYWISHIPDNFNYFDFLDYVDGDDTTIFHYGIDAIEYLNRIL